MGTKIRERGESALLERDARSGAGFAKGFLRHDGGDQHVFQDASVFEEQTALHQEAHGAAQRSPLEFVVVIDAVARHDHFAFGGLSQTAQHFQHERLAASRGAVKQHEFSTEGGKREVLKAYDVVDRYADLSEFEKGRFAVHGLFSVDAKGEAGVFPTLLLFAQALVGEGTVLKPDRGQRQRARTFIVPHVGEGGLGAGLKKEEREAQRQNGPPEGIAFVGTRVFGERSLLPLQKVRRFKAVRASNARKRPVAKELRGDPRGVVAGDRLPRFVQESRCVQIAPQAVRRFRHKK